ncbi:PD-(D/E)XK nuclease-like domain-containing protein [Vibrio sp. SCSIO 43139]|uniref:PD-(D/E)XK nuclease-like domain-containing protein n=2 Tax=Vibrionaceae TaxID=641 RepID=UPI00207565CB|nr:PD-(D/E)XK nuclease-like domain-containing protein [Vibrio sp. SCSIO 43139]USD72661.1 PD-(D/E)XK nuclease-like domain-containing protein [Vibrio sp. SCSIO 43139]
MSVNHEEFTMNSVSTNANINRISAASIHTHFEVAPILSTPTGCIIPLSDQEYRKIKAHSKSSLSPVFKSGTDYKFFTVDKRGERKTNSGMEDGSLLHCMLLEEASFSQKYVISKDYDAIHKDNPLYFSDVDKLKSFVTQHNKVYSELKKKLVESIKEFNEESKQEHKKITTYEQLPPKARTAKASKAATHRLFAKVMDELLIEVDASSSESQQVKQIEVLVSTFEQEISLAISDMKAFSESSTLQKVAAVNSLVGTLRSIFAAKNDEDKLKCVPTEWYYAEISESAKAKAISSYNRSQANGVKKELLNDKASPQEMIEQLKRECSPVISKLNDSYGQNLNFYCSKIVTVGGKKTCDSTYSCREVLADIKRVYNGAPVLRNELIDEEERIAGLNNQTLISQEQYDHAKRIVDAALNHPKAGPILRAPGNQYEVAMFWNEIIQHDALSELPDTETQSLNNDPRKRQVLCKAKADILNLSMNFISDTKFMSTIEFDAMERDAGKFTYHVQASFYKNGFNQIVKSLPDGPEELTEFALILIEKDAKKLGDDEIKPTRIRVAKYKVHHLERASRMTEYALVLTEVWNSTGNYDGFEDVDDIDVPAYQVKAEERWIANANQRLTKSNLTDTPVLQKNDGIDDLMPDFDLIANAR